MEQGPDHEMQIIEEAGQAPLAWGKRQVVRHVLLSVCFLIFYILLTRSDIIVETQLGFTVWYPPTGLALALMLGISPWYALLVCIADAASGALVYHQPLVSWGEALGAPATSAIYAGAAIILRGSLRIDTGLNHRRDVVRYVFVTTIAALSATSGGVWCLVADHTIPRSEFWHAAFNWFSGDSIALVGVAPFLLIHVLPRVRRKLFLGPTNATKPGNKRRKRDGRFTVSSIAESVGQGVSIIVVLWIMFGKPFALLQLFYLSLLPIIWIAMRHGIKRVTTGILALDFGIVVAMRIYSLPTAALTRVEILMFVVSFTGLIVGSAVSERHRIGKELREQTAYLNSLIENTPLGVVVLDENSRVHLCNDAFENLFLFRRDELIGKELDSRISPPAAVGEAIEFTAQVVSGRHVHTVGRRVRKDGKLLDVEFNAVPLILDGELRGSFAIYKDISEQIAAQEQTKRNEDSLNQLVEELQLRTTQMVILKEMGDLLQCCATAEEAYTVVANSVGKLLPIARSGILYVFKSSRNAVETAAVWGTSRASEPVFDPQMCWALRRGQPHWSDCPGTGVVCDHLKNLVAAKCLCVPMVAQGDTLGVLHLEFGSGTEARSDVDREAARESVQRLASTVAGQIALSLASLRSRETLRDQSIRDSLTGLFNRRYMQESLDRELRRARRKKRPLSVVFLDLDHFKRFNDRFGHEAGDAVLRRMAEVFRDHFRGDDIVCRYGGEEFAIILPESTAKDAAKRANVLRAEARKITLLHQGQVLDPVTFSVGVASFPEHATSVDEILRAADQSLYQSKADGRDRVTVATLQTV
jgi:diguanylate cyclase (GGDEF)-like protein/PAS domain S-box-containing protein